MKNSRILLSAFTAGILCSVSFGDSGINWQLKGGNWEKCSGDACLTTNVNAGIYADNGDANDASVTLNKDHTANVYGGWAEEGDANKNKVFVKGGSKFSNIYGGYVAKNGSANRNEVTIEASVNPTITNVYGGRTSGSGEGDANNNTVIIESGNITSSVYGGSAGSTGEANNNTVIIKNGTIKSVYGGSAKTNAIGNNVIITGGTITDALIGGKGGEVNGNKVAISNATISGTQIFVGWSTGTSASENILIIDNGANITSSNVFVGFSTKGKAHNNVLVFKDGTISSNTALYGGYSTNDSAGNQLIVANKGFTAKSVNNFQEYFFALPSGINANDTMLTLTDKLTFNDTDKIGVGAMGELTNLKAGEKVTLINNVAGFKAGMDNLTLNEVKHKDTKNLIDTSYKFELSQDENKLNAKLLGEEKKSSEESKALSEGTAGAAAAIVEAGSVMADKGISSAMNQANANVGAGKTTDNFGAIGFGSSRYQTGSYVDSKSINISVGVALGQEVKYGKVLVGPFIELGYSDYETHNDFSTGHVKGDGISKYLGGGIFARHDWNSVANGHPYVEGSVRFGRNKNSFDSTDMGQSYKSNAFYYGAHLGLGYIVEFQNNSNLDFYAKYFYTHLNSDDVTTNQGANLNLDAVNSHKTRFGARYNHALNNSSQWQIKPYVGLAWEHEYKGDANARNGGYAVEAPSLEGSSGLAEIGVNIGKEKGFSADLGVAGYAGKRRGVAGNIMIKYEF